MTQPIEPCKVGILDDEELQELADFSPLPEGGCMEDLVAVMADVMQAMPPEAATLTNGKARTLFLLRSFYLLGVLRGGETYRSHVAVACGVPDFETIPFALHPYMTELFVDDLNSLTAGELNRVYSMLGFSASKAADKAEAGDE